MRKSILGMLVMLGSILPATAFAVNCCSLNGGTCTTPATITHGTAPWTGAICGTTISGTNCTAILDTGATLASGTCLTIGKGVTLDFNGQTLTCNSSECGAGVLVTDSGASSNAVEIKNGDITGCWTYGILQYQYVGTNTKVHDMFVDLDRSTGTCTGFGGGSGIAFIPGTLDHVVVKDAYSGIYLLDGEDVKNSKVYGCSDAGGAAGIVVNGSGTSFDNVLLTDNYVNVFFNIGAPASLQRSELQNAAHCDCQTGATCPSISTCFTITNATTPTFIGDAIIP